MSKPLYSFFTHSSSSSSLSDSASKAAALQLPGPNTVMIIAANLYRSTDKATCIELRSVGSVKSRLMSAACAAPWSTASTRSRSTRSRSFRRCALRASFFACATTFLFFFAASVASCWLQQAEAVLGLSRWYREIRAEIQGCDLELSLHRRKAVPPS